MLTWEDRLHSRYYLWNKKRSLKRLDIFCNILFYICNHFKNHFYKIGNLTYQKKYSNSIWFKKLYYLYIIERIRFGRVNFHNFFFDVRKFLREWLRSFKFSTSVRINLNLAFLWNPFRKFLPLYLVYIRNRVEWTHNAWRQKQN